MSSTDPQFGENITCGSLSDEATLNELVGEVGQVQTDCVGQYCSVLIHDNNVGLENKKSLK